MFFELLHLIFMVYPYPPDTKRSPPITGEEWKGLWEEVARGNGKQPRTGLAEKLNASGAHGIMGEEI